MAGPDFFTPEWLDENPQMGPSLTRPEDARTMPAEADMPAPVTVLAMRTEQGEQS